MTDGTLDEEPEEESGISRSAEELFGGIEDEARSPEDSDSERDGQQGSSDGDSVEDRTANDVFAQFRERDVEKGDVGEILGGESPEDLIAAADEDEPRRDDLVEDAEALDELLLTGRVAGEEFLWIDTDGEESGPAADTDPETDDAVPLSTAIEMTLEGDEDGPSAGDREDGAASTTSETGSTPADPEEGPTPDGPDDEPTSTDPDDEPTPDGPEDEPTERDGEDSTAEGDADREPSEEDGSVEEEEGSIDGSVEEEGSIDGSVEEEGSIDGSVEEPTAERDASDSHTDLEETSDRGEETGTEEADLVVYDDGDEPTGLFGRLRELLGSLFRR